MSNRPVLFPWFVTAVYVFLGFMFLSPWVKVGAAFEVESVNGVDIPVLGIATGIAGGLGALFALIATLRDSRWWWSGANFVSALVVTCSALTLAFLDVADSKIFDWIVKALPDEYQDSAPQLSADTGLWIMFGLGSVASILSLWMVASASKRFALAREAKQKAEESGITEGFVEGYGVVPMPAVRANAPVLDRTEFEAPDY